MSDVLVSIIMPVYNVEGYIQQSIESVLKQTLTNIEVLVVDDCGTDTSMEIVKKYARKDDRITIIKQKENKGVSAARNLGIESARGKYVAFLDSDDYIEEDFLEKMFCCAERISLDLVISGYVNNEGDMATCRFHRIRKWLMTPKEAMYEMICKNHFDWSPCDKLYLREQLITNDILFNVRYRMGEDLDFVWRYLRCIRKVMFLPLYKYHYVNRMDSATHKKKSDLRLDSVEIMRNIMLKNKCDMKIYLRMRELYAKEIGSCIKDILLLPNMKLKVKSLQIELRKNVIVGVLNKDFSIFIKCAISFFCLPYWLCFWGYKGVSMWSDLDDG